MYVCGGYDQFRCPQIPARRRAILFLRLLSSPSSRTIKNTHRFQALPVIRRPLYTRPIKGSVEGLVTPRGPRSIPQNTLIKLFLVLGVRGPW